MGNAWMGPSGLFFNRNMGCKFNDTYETAVQVHLIAIAVLRPFLHCLVWRKVACCSSTIGIVGVGSMS
jgi:hypothetical protein